MKCKDCRYWRDGESVASVEYINGKPTKTYKNIASMCHRYPAPLHKKSEEWCGEYKPSK